METPVIAEVETSSVAGHLPRLEMTGIGKRFPGVIALNNVNLQVYQREIVGLIGENGAGKSTLMKILGGIHQPDAGSISLEGRTVTIASVRESIGLGIGIIHQELNVQDNLDVAGNVFLGREPTWAGPLRLIDQTAICAQTEKYLRLLDLKVSPKTPLSKLSIAQKQLVEIAKALSLNASILIMDEPTSSLTLSETDRLMEITKDLQSRGISIIYITHRLAEIEHLADRVVALRDGRNAGVLERSEISHDRMVSLMVGRDLSKFHIIRESSDQHVLFEVRDLRTTARPNTQVSLAIKRGEIMGLAGLIGAGRSEFAQTIFGIDKSMSGEILLDGKSLKIDSPKDAIHHGIYLVPEDRRNTGLITAMSVRENITLPALERYSGAGLIKSRDENSVAKRYSEELRIKTASIETKASDLSGGNQQKVVLAKWLSLNPRVIIFDEPTRGIDVGAKAEIYHLMRRLADQGVAILMISSGMEEILGNSDRVAVMHQGQITGILERANCSEEAILHLAIGHAARRQQTLPS